MSISIDCNCDECSKLLNDGDEAICRSCFDSKVEEMRKEIDDLTASRNNIVDDRDNTDEENEKLKNRIVELDAENAMLKRICQEMGRDV